MLPDDVAATLDLIGLQPVIVEKLNKAAILLPDHGLVLIRRDLGEDGLRDVASRCLSVAASALRV